MRRTMMSRTATALACLLTWGLWTTPAALGQVGPDVTVSTMGSIAKNGTVGNITAYSISTTSCNRGDAVATWIDPTQNPVIGGNIYRVSGDGLLEQLGMSWLKHGFCAVSEPSCGACQATNCDTLGIACADTYGTGLNGAQNNLGPKSEVNASDGTFIPHNDTSTGNAIYKRIQVNNDDLNPALNAGSSYFAVAQYITVDETSWGNMFNNNSWRQLIVEAFDGNGYPLSYTGGTIEAEDPILAWQNFTAGVAREVISTPEQSGLGQVIAGSRVLDLGGGVYRYQYAVFNNNSDRSIGSFSVPIPAGLPISNVHFNDVDSHSGEPYDNTDWPSSQTASEMSWAADTHATNSNANAIRWGTTYTFAFDAAAAPVAGTGTLGLFKPGTGSSVTFPTQVPSGTFILPIANLSCTPSFNMTELAWTNGQAYTGLEVSRDGVLLATLSGSATSYTDTAPAEGPHTYSVNAINGATQSGNVNCSVTTPPPPPLEFDLIAETLTANYDSGSGVGSFDARLSVLEDAANVVYPNNIRGVSISLASDSNMVTPTACNQSSALSAMNAGAGADFFAPSFYTNGATVGVYFDFNGGEAILATAVSDIATLTYDTNATSLAGNLSGATTTLVWQSGLGAVPVPNSILLDNSAEAIPNLVDGVITLVPVAGPPRFIRGDCNQDMSLDISDPIQMLVVQFLGGAADCIDACDADDNSAFGLPDALATLQYLFQGGAPLPSPFTACGIDPTADALDCSTPSCP